MAIVAFISIVYALLAFAGFDLAKVGSGLGGILFWSTAAIGFTAWVVVGLSKPDEFGRRVMQRLVALSMGTAFVALILKADALSFWDGFPLFIVGAWVTSLAMSWVMPKHDLPATTDGLFIAAMTLILGAGVFVFRAGFDGLWAEHPLVGSLAIVSALLLMFGGVVFVHSRAGRFPIREAVA